MRTGAAILVLAAGVFAGEELALAGLREDTRPAREGALRLSLDFITLDGKRESRSVLVQDARMRSRLLSSGTPFLFPETPRTAFLLIRRPRQLLGVRLSWEHDLDVEKSFQIASPERARSRPIRTSASSFALLSTRGYIHVDLKVQAARHTKFWYQPFAADRTRNHVYVWQPGKRGVRIGYRSMDVCSPPNDFEKPPQPYNRVADVRAATPVGAVNPGATRVALSENADRKRFVLTVASRAAETLVRRSFRGRLEDLRWTDDDHLVLLTTHAGKTTLHRLDVTDGGVDHTPLDAGYLAPPAFVPAKLLPKTSPG